MGTLRLIGSNHRAGPARLYAGIGNVQTVRFPTLFRRESLFARRGFIAITITAGTSLRRVYITRVTAQVLRVGSRVICELATPRTVTSVPGQSKAGISACAASDCAQRFVVGMVCGRLGGRMLAWAPKSLNIQEN